MKLRLTILFAFIFGSSITQSQSSWRIDQLTISEGLSQGYIYAIHQDKKGFIWIGTHGGLNRYDGYNFKVFQYMPFNSASLGDNSVFFLTEDSMTHKFWIGGSSCLNEFDPETFINTRYRYNNKQLEFSDGIFINKNEILLACEYDVLLFDTKSKTFVRIPVYDENNREVSISRVENTTKDKKGNYMIMSKTGIFFFDPGSRTCKRKTESSPDFSAFYKYEIFNVFEDKEGYYWIATNKKGLIRYDPNTNKTTTLPLPAGLKNESLRFDVVMQDMAGNIWAGSSEGLFKIDPESLATEYFSSDRNQPVSLSHPEINVITEDRNHFMWIGTVGGGINKMILQNVGFKNLHISSEKSGNSTGTYIMALQEIGNDIWFMNIWDQVGKVNLKTGEVTTLNKPVMPLSYSWYSEGTILKDENDNPVVLNGENLYNIEIKDRGNISVRSQASTGLIHIHHSSNGHIYYMVKTAVQKTYCRNDTIYGNEFFYDGKDDNAANLWIGTSKGLFRLDTKTKDMVQFQHDDKNPNSISSDFIYSLEIDNENENIWMAAYHGGLCSYNMKTGKFRNYTKDDGLPDNIVYSIEKDNSGNLWFSTNAGISTYNMDSKIFRNYGKADGLLNNEYNRRASFKNSEGWIFFGGILGIDYFHPDSIIKKNTIPNLAFTGFKVFNHDYVADNSKPVPVIELNHKDRYIAIDFAALDFHDQYKIQYAYRLDPTKEWIKLGNQHSLAFTDWATGKHTLYIRSTNLEGLWMNNEISCSIIIHPAWWQTWWFRLLVVAILLVVTAILVREYFKSKLQKQRISLEKQQAIEKERTRIAMEMHDDLGSGLTTIRYLAGGLSSSIPEGMKNKASKIVNSAKELIDSMNDIIWTIKSDNNSLEELLAYIRKQAAEQLENSAIDYKFDFPNAIPDIKLSSEQKRNLLMISKEAVHNIVKHAMASHVQLKAETGNGFLQLSFIDNGKGINKIEKKHSGNGLKNMQRRAEEIGARMEIKNSQGTTVSVTIHV